MSKTTLKDAATLIAEIEEDDPAIRPAADVERIDELAKARARERRQTTVDDLIRRAELAESAEANPETVKLYASSFVEEPKLFQALERAEREGTPDEARRAWDNCWRNIHRCGDAQRAAAITAAKLRVEAADLEDETSQTWFNLVREEKAKIERVEASNRARGRRKVKDEVLFKAPKSKQFRVERGGDVLFSSVSKASAQSWRSKHHKGEPDVTIVDLNTGAET